MNSTSLAKANDSYLNRERALKAAARMELLFAEGDERFPSVVDTLWQMFNDESELVTEKYGKEGEIRERSTRPRIDAKQKVAIANAFARFIVIKDTALADRGLSRAASGPKTQNNYFSQNNLNLSPDDLDRLPEDVRRKIVDARLDAFSPGQS